MRKKRFLGHFKKQLLEKVCPVYEHLYFIAVMERKKRVVMERNN